MSPEEDATWPGCTVFPPCEKVWCNHVRELLVENKDSVPQGVPFAVPIVPTFNMWAEVIIEGASIAPGMSLMYLAKEPPFGTQPDMISLGLWTIGEGRFSIATVINDWIKANRPAPENSYVQCPSTAHGVNEQRVLEQFQDTENFGKANLWCILIKSMCYPCYQKYLNNFAGQTFGMGGVSGAFSGSAISAATRQQLRNRNK